MIKAHDVGMGEPEKNYVAQERVMKDMIRKEQLEILRLWDTHWSFLREEYAKMNKVSLKNVQAAENKMAEEVDRALGIKLPPIPYYPKGLEKWRNPPTTSGFYGFRQTKDSPTMKSLKRFHIIAKPKHSMSYLGMPYGTND